MLTGPQALNSLNDALKEIRREENQINSRVLKASERVVELNRQEAEQFKKLAAIRLSAIDNESIVKELTGAENRAAEILSKRDSRISEHNDDVRDLEKRMSEIEAERANLEPELESIETELDELSVKVAQKLKSNRTYAKKSSEAQKIVSQAVAASNKYETAQLDRIEKSKPYHNDSLFMYLYERKFGTNDYKASNLITTMDGWVANLIRFQHSRPNYVMLNTIPDRLQEHAKRQKSLAEEAQNALHDYEKKALKKEGGDELEAKLQAILAKRQAFDEEILELEDERDEIVAERQLVAQGQDPDYKKALDLITSNLRSKTLSDLYQSAFETPTDKDETIVSQIEELRERRKFERKQSDEDRTRLETLAKRRQELENIQWEFKKERFDDPMSSFGQDDLVGPLLTEFLRGAISATTYWGHWKSNQKWRKKSSKHFGGRRGFPDDLDDFGPLLGDILTTVATSSGGRRSSRSNSGFSRKRRKSGSKRSRSRSKSNRGFKTGGGF